MATIQVRELPENAYEELRRRARRSGQSMQAYLRDELIALAARPTKDEAIEVIEALAGRPDIAWPSQAAILDDLATDRR
jgi:plasmid stability protein